MRRRWWRWWRQRRRRRRHVGRATAAVLPTGALHTCPSTTRCVGNGRGWEDAVPRYVPARPGSFIDSLFSMRRAVTLRANLTERSSIVPEPPSLTLSYSTFSLFRFPFGKSHVLSAFFTLFDRQNVCLLDTFLRFATVIILTHVSTRLRKYRKVVVTRNPSNEVRPFGVATVLGHIADHRVVYGRACPPACILTSLPSPVFRSATVV